LHRIWPWSMRIESDIIFPSLRPYDNPVGAIDLCEGVVSPERAFSDRQRAVNQEVGGTIVALRL